MPNGHPRLSLFYVITILSLPVLQRKGNHVCLQFERKQSNYNNFLYWTCLHDFTLPKLNFTCLKKKHSNLCKIIAFLWLNNFWEMYSVSEILMGLHIKATISRYPSTFLENSSRGSSKIAQLSNGWRVGYVSLPKSWMSESGFKKISCPTILYRYFRIYTKKLLYKCEEVFNYALTYYYIRVFEEKMEKYVTQRWGKLGVKSI